MTVRSADKVAQSITRKIVGGISTSAPTSTDPAVAQGRTGSDDCVLTVGVDPTVSGNTTITCYWFSTFMGKWLLAGANSGVYQKVFEPGTADVFVLPEQSAFFLKGSQAISDGLICVDGTLN
jgi:hypothetical protein